MKIRQLHINRFGHFTDCDLVFPGEGLQVIYGPNEAGKTTLLEFLRGVLFDFPARTPYDFGGLGEVAGVATLELHDGRSVELRRRKGNKDKVAIKINGIPTELDDTGWLRLLDHADRTLFESVFAFGLNQLSRGEESLKHESLQSALFGSGLGGTSSPDRVLAEIGRQADELFKKGGSKPTINALLADLKSITKDIKDCSLRPESYHQAVKEADKATETAKTLSNQVDALRRKHAQLEKQIRAWPKWWELQQLRSDRAQIGVLPALPTDARKKYVDLGKELKEHEETRADKATQIERVNGLLGALQLNPVAVLYRIEIKSCLELRQSFIDARDQLPERRQERKNLQLQIDQELQEHRPGWSHADLRAFSVNVATRAEIDRLTEDFNIRRTSVATIAAKQESDATDLERLRIVHAAICVARDITVLEGVLADETAYAGDLNELNRNRVELAKLQLNLTSQIRQLTPPLAVETTAPHVLPVPRVETVSEFQDRLAELAENLRAANSLAREDETEYRKLEELLAAARKSRVVPSLEERDAARARRDTGWDLVRRRYIAAEPVDADIAAWLDVEADVNLPDGYERAVRQADGLADQIYDNANEVAVREGQHRRLTELELRLNQKRQEIANLERQQSQLQEEWIALWRPCGFEPLTPDAMCGWLQQHAAVCTAFVKCAELATQLTPLGERIESFEQRLRVASGMTGEDFSSMLALVRQSVEDEKHRRRKAIDSLIEVRRLEKQLANHNEALQVIQGQEVTAQSAWRAVLERLNLPAEWDTELTRKVIDQLKTTRVRLESLPSVDDRIVKMESRVEEFNRRVQALCEAMAPELLHDPAELAVKKLDEQVERAVEAQRNYDDLTQRLPGLHKMLKLSGERLQMAEAERGRLFAAAATTTEEEFLKVVTRTETAARLERDIEQLQREINLIRAGDDPAEFEQALSTSELAILHGREDDLKQQLKEVETLRNSAVGEEALAREALGRLDGSEAAAKLNGELACKRSQLATEVDRYMPLIYARHLLNKAVSRFEKENQPEMIVTVSRLLGQLTGGTYIEFDRSGAGKQTALVRRSDGVERTPDQLSTGTREQLYLAIRLAYVLHYCERNQPLPIIIDDVLVNFDESRSRQTLAVLADISRSVQVLLFTCHPHLVNMACDTLPGMKPIELPRQPAASRR